MMAILARIAVHRETKEPRIGLDTIRVQFHKDRGHT